jgi:hypothetical protein
MKLTDEFLAFISFSVISRSRTNQSPARARRNCLRMTAVLRFAAAEA